MLKALLENKKAKLLKASLSFDSMQIITPLF
ncbi:hypothetical protein ABIC84_003069 [Mucilaginibacter sp. 3215]